MEIVTHTFPVKSRQSDEVLVVPVGDIQWYGDEKGTALSMLKKCIQWGVDHGAYFLGMGDYVDAFSPSNRQRLRSAALYDTAHSVIDQKAEALVKELYEVALKPSRGRWLGLLEGHHYHQFGTGITTDMMLADMLKTRHLGTAAYVRLRFLRGGTAGGQDVLIWCHHGSGAGQTPAAVLNKLHKTAAQWKGDIFLMGHLPRKCTDSIDALEPIFPQKGDPYLIHRTKILAGTGGYMKTWVPQSRQGIVPRGGYGEQAMYTPASLGGVLVKIRPRWKREEQASGAVAARELWVPDLGVES